MALSSRALIAARRPAIPSAWRTSWSVSSSLAEAFAMWMSYTWPCTLSIASLYSAIQCRIPRRHDASSSAGAAGSSGVKCSCSSKKSRSDALECNEASKRSDAKWS